MGVNASIEGSNPSFSASRRASPAPAGGVAERSNAAVSKTVSGRLLGREFESHPLRFLSFSGRQNTSVFTVEQRDALRDRVLEFAHADERVVAGAEVGSLAAGTGDEFSDLDLTFGISGAEVADVLEDWTRTLVDEKGAVRLADLPVGPTIYRVFLFPDALQFDLSMTPSAEFRPAGPKWKLLFGEEAEGDAPVRPGPGNLFIPTPAVAEDLFGWGVIYALHSRSCIRRGRVWQAGHYTEAVRDHAMSLACLTAGVTVVQARGYDDLPAETLVRFEDALVGSLEPAALEAALAAGVRALMHEGAAAGLPHAEVVSERLAELC